MQSYWSIKYAMTILNYIFECYKQYMQFYKKKGDLISAFEKSNRNNYLSAA
jgi:hypothetical protein